MSDEQIDTPADQFAAKRKAWLDKDIFDRAVQLARQKGVAEPHQMDRFDAMLRGFYARGMITGRSSGPHHMAAMNNTIANAEQNPYLRQAFNWIRSTTLPLVNRYDKRIYSTKRNAYRPQTVKIAQLVQHIKRAEVTPELLAAHMGKVSPTIQKMMYNSGYDSVANVTNKLRTMGTTAKALGLAGLTAGGLYGAIRPIKKEERNKGHDRMSSIARRALTGGLLAGGTGLLLTAPGYIRAINDMVNKGTVKPV